MSRRHKGRTYLHRAQGSRLSRAVNELPPRPLPPVGILYFNKSTSHKLKELNLF